MLNRRPSLTEQAKTHIKQRILNDEFDGARIPSETELANQLGVSRTTIRDALSRLQIEGVILRKQGAGTFVNRAGLRIKSRLEEIWGYENVLEDHGYSPSTKILSVRQESPDSEAAERLRLGAGEKLLVVEKLFLANEKPVILTINRIPLGLIRRPFVEADFHVPAYQFLLEFGQQRLSHYLSEIVPTVVSGALSEILKLEPGSALLTFEESGYNEANEPIILARSHFRDDLLRFRLIRREVR
jgi:GntR family transcriptional regulator